MIDFPIINSHIHLLDQKRLGYGWASGAPKLNRDWTANDLAAAAQPYAISGFVFVEVDVDYPQHMAEAEWVQGLAKTDPRIKAIVAALPMEQGAAVEADMARLAKLPAIRGVRRLIQNQRDPEFCVKPDFVQAVKMLPKYKLSFDICIFHYQLPKVIELVGRCPEVNFILDHIAKPAIREGRIDPWRQHLRELAQAPNVVCKLSGVATEARHDSWSREQLRPYIDHAIACFGPDRLMYGGDWPVSELAVPYADWVSIVDEATAHFGATDKRKLFRDNAVRFYRLDGATASR